MTTNGFDKSDSALFMMVVAISEVVGKVVISAVADSLPFPKIYLFVLASILGVVVMVVLLVASSLGLMLGLAVGKSIKITTPKNAIVSVVLAPDVHVFLALDVPVVLAPDVPVVLV